jgi:hypothetical protein
VKKVRQFSARRLWLAGASFVALTALAVTVGLNGTGVRYDAQPEGTADGREIYHFTDVASMTATSNLVVYGDVVSVDQGRLTGGEDDGAAVGGEIRLRSVTITVYSVLHNPKNLLVPPSIILEEEGWDDEGRGYITNNVAWSQVGDSGYFFLRKSVGANTYRLTSSDGRALIVNDSLQPSNPENELAGQIAGMQPTALNAAVQQASQQYATGQLGASLETADNPLPPDVSGE